MDKRLKFILEEEFNEEEFAEKKASNLAQKEQIKAKERNNAESGEKGVANIDDMKAADESMEIKCAEKGIKKVKKSPAKEDKETSTTDFFKRREEQTANKLQQTLEEEIKNRKNVEKNFWI